MSSDHGAKPSGQPRQSAGDISVSGQENPLALTNAGGDVAIDQSRQVTIYNYYYREESRTVPVEFAEPDNDLPCPYRGLFHFGPSDAEFFFGREVFVTELIEAVETRAFVPVLGASGSGKSSVVFAGLVPRLQQTGHWLFTHFRPGEDPFHGLALALVPLYAPNLDQTDQIAQARKLANYLRNQDFPLTDVIAQIQQNCPNQRVLLIADQFEELYTLCKDEHTRRQFLDCLLSSLSTATSNTFGDTTRTPTTPPPRHPITPNAFGDATRTPLTLVATMRADFLGSALAYRPFADVLQAGDIKLGAMNRDELTEVIEQPAARLGVTFEPGLVKRILDAVDQQPGNLPLLEFALTELWKRRHHQQLTHAAYGAIGKVQGALARYADEQYARLSETEKDQVRRIFIQLVRPGEGAEDTRRLATKAELGEERWALVKRLADTRLVVTSQDETKQETVEVVHEALIRNWGELRGWMERDREFRTWQERLRGAMQQWEATNQDEGALLRGTALVDAEANLKQRREDLSEGAKKFIQASAALRIREEKERERSRKLTILSLAGGLGVALVLVGLAAIGWRRAQISEINSLAQSSDGFLNLNGRKALQSSIEAAVKMRRQLWGVNANTRTQVELALLNTVQNVAVPNTLGGHAKSVNGVNFSPDGKTLASASDDNTVRLWDTAIGKGISTLTGHTNLVNGVSFSPDDKMLASASADKTVKLWDLATGQEIQTLTGHIDAINEVSFSPNSKMLASASDDKTVKLWDTDSGMEIKTLTGHTEGIIRVSFNPDGGLLASASSDNMVKLWDVSTGQEIQAFTGHTGWVLGVSFSPDSKVLASASSDNTVKLWDVSTGQEIQTLIGTNSVNDVSFSPDGKVLASASSDNTVKLWDTITGQEIMILTGHTNSVNDVSFSRDSALLASASDDNTVKLWDTNTGQEIKPLTGHTEGAGWVSFSPDSRMLASAGADKIIRLWDTVTSQEVETLTGHTDWIWGVSFSPDGRMLASVSSDKTARLWNIITGQEIKILTGHTDWISGVSFSIDGKMLATASADKTVRLWDTVTGQEIKILTGHTDWVYRVSFSPDGKILASASIDKTVRLWDIATGQEIKILTGHTDWVSGASFSPDGKILATASADKTVRLWDTATGQEIKTLTGHTDWVYMVSFSPNGKLLASTSGDKTVKLWNSATGQEIKTLTGHTEKVLGVSFSPNSKMIASASADKTVKLWRWDFDYLLEEGCNFMEEYYKVNPADNKSGKHLCNGVLPHTAPPTL